MSKLDEICSSNMVGIGGTQRKGARYAEKWALTFDVLCLGVGLVVICCLDDRLLRVAQANRVEGTQHPLGSLP